MSAERGRPRLRDRKCLELLNEARIDVIKGNASEVARVSGESVRTRGVDATEVGGDLALLAEKLADQRKATVVITGKVDIATDGKQTYLVQNGHPMMTRVVGTGCMATSVIGAFAAVERDLSLAAACALACYGIAAELAAEKAVRPRVVQGAAIRLPLRPGPGNRGPDAENQDISAVTSGTQESIPACQDVRASLSSAARSSGCVNISTLPSPARGHCSRGRSR